MPHDLRELPTDLQAAHVVLLMLRAAVKAAGRTPHVYRPTPQDQPLDADAMAQILAPLPKPIAVDGTRKRRFIEVTTEPAQESRAPIVRHELQLRERHPARSADLRDFLQERYRDHVDELPVACVGGGSVLIAHASAAMQAQRDYVIARPHGYGLDWADSSRAHRTDLGDAVAYLSFGGGGWFVQLSIPRFWR
jgi:hypothetical protein